MKRIFLTMGRVFSRAEDLLLALLLGIMIVLAVGQIVQRNLLGSGFVWTDELLRILVLWLTMVGSIIASRTDHHIRMDLLLNLVAPLWQRRIKRLVHGCTALACGMLSWASTRFVLMEAEFDSLLLGNYPAWWFQIILPVGFALIAWRYMLLTLWPCESADPPGSEPCC
ncbi:MAG: TRAP transporter small permease [Thermodesulfobacteriota bacterium]|nr:TRAP transporter small permease [Thermodesulfobacteriota bacterium]